MSGARATAPPTSASSRCRSRAASSWPPAATSSPAPPAGNRSGADPPASGPLIHDLHRPRPAVDPEPVAVVEQAGSVEGVHDAGDAELPGHHGGVRQLPAAVD